MAIGHNTIAGDKLRQYVERIERLESDKSNIADDIRDIYSVAKAEGFCAKTMREIIKIRKKDEAERIEQETLLDVYKAALGMQLEMDV